MAPAADDAATMADDWQQQVDEVQALEAIFGADFRLLEASGLSSDGGGGSSSSADPPPQQLDAAALAMLAPPPCCSGGGTGGASSSSSGGGGGGWALDCCLMVQVAPPGGSLRLLLPEPESGSGGDEQPGSSDEQPGEDGSGSGSGGGGYTIQHLPPLCLQLRLGPGYPSQRPPEVGLSALWLSSAQAAALEAQLGALWGELGGGGAPICFTWADWLQSGALEHLGAAQALSLEGSPAGGDEEEGGGPAGGADPSGSGSGSDGGGGGGGGGGAEDRLMMLLRYNALREQHAFQEGMHTCGVCLGEQRGAAFIRLDCRHAWCRECVVEQARIHVAEGTLERLKCPDPRCGAPLQPGVLQRVLPPDDFERWEQLTLQRTLDTMPDAAYCPRCSAVSLEDDDSCAQCPRCLYVFCSLCMEGWHPGTQCVSAETKLAMLRRKMEGGGRAAVEDLRRQEQDLLSAAQIEKMAKRCPKCGMATQKDEGCNKMACGGCGAYWCWRCGKEIDGYKHFRTGECILFDEAEIMRWEAQWEEMQAAARVAAAGMRNDFLGETAARQGRARRGCFCPQCGQLNHKMANNNYMKCWSCTSHFCYVCRALLRSTGTHYKPGMRCKQHSAD